MLPNKTSVAIVGGGPCGLMLANELGRRGVTAVLVDQKPATAFNPQANATQARTMEYFRRLGFADEVRALGLPADFPTDIAYFTRYASWELARFSLPSASEASTKSHTLSGSWSAAELPHRVSQKFVEQVLRRHAEALPRISVNYGWRMLDFRDRGDGVEVRVECLATGARQTIQADYMVGADGARSRVRDALGIHYGGETGVVRDFMGGHMLAMYVRAPEFYRTVCHAPAWMNVCVNPERRAFMAAVDGKGEFAFHAQLKPDEEGTVLDERNGRNVFAAAMGTMIPFEVLSVGSWIAGHALVAERFGNGRVFLGGDAAHLFTPAGGLGYNTAVEDAVNLGWKLAAAIKGHAGRPLLDSYAIERRPVAIRNTAYARGFADSLGLFKPDSSIEEDSPVGRAARQQAGAYFNQHARAEFDIPGITFGSRYDTSPVVIADGTPAPPDAANQYEPTATPGGRPPHLWLDDGRSLYDAFGLDWTLLCTGRNTRADALMLEAQRRGLDLTVVHLPEARDLYQADYALIRPDQIVAWRGNGCTPAAQMFDRLLGTTTPGASATGGQ